MTKTIIKYLIYYKCFQKYKLSNLLICFTLKCSLCAHGFTNGTIGNSACWHDTVNTHTIFSWVILVYLSAALLSLPPLHLFHTALPHVTVQELLQRWFLHVVSAQKLLCYRVIIPYVWSVINGCLTVWNKDSRDHLLLTKKKY